MAEKMESTPRAVEGQRPEVGEFGHVAPPFAQAKPGDDKPNEPLAQNPGR